MSKYNIKIASNLSGVGTHTLRAWEKRYLAVVPARSSSGRRLYSDSDIEKLQLLSELCSLGNSIGSIANKDSLELKEMLERLGKVKQNIRPVKYKASSTAEVTQSLKLLLEAIENYQIEVLSKEIGSLKKSLNTRDLALKVLSPLLSELRHKVEQGNLSIAQEHALLSMVKFHVGDIIYESYECKNKNPSLISIASPSGELDEFDIILFSLLCSHYGVKFFYLGANLPLTPLIDATNSFEANILLLSIKSNSSQSYIEELYRKIGADRELWVSGVDNIKNSSVLNETKFRAISDLFHLDNCLKELGQG
ncbi:MerR family transcriptional regulator [Halobacteriovorax sp.]|uniref:MerR family transcriptional regulator n=1 Tax=Halobacteriovorax sp. TaxID=2020862 RepID=UPI0035698A47